MTHRVLALDPRTYERHAIHGAGRTWAETNCYVDVWIELLHALGREPAASLAFTLAIDFEGDQWTFFKCPLADLHELYGLDVQELAVWRPLASHIDEQVRQGRPVLVELDSYFLPDTAGTAYRRTHTKSTAAIVEIDLARRWMGYFHNQGYYQLEGEDFVDALRLRGESAALLPPYVEFVKIGAPPEGESIARRSLQLLSKHLRRVPARNPFARFRERLAADLAWLVERDLETFHQYSFATLRQLGACFELAQTYLQWLDAQGERGLQDEARACGEISQGAKVFQFQLARAMARGKALDLSPLDAMAEQWSRATSGLKSRYA